MENGDYKSDPMKRLVYKHDVIVTLAEKIDEPIDIVEALKNLTVVDAVEVVRCKDCKWRYKGPSGDVCDLTQIQMADDDYCSLGERKDGESE